MDKEKIGEDVPAPNAQTESTPAEKEKKKGLQVKPVQVIGIAVLITVLIAIAYLYSGAAPHNGGIATSVMSLQQTVATGDNVSVYYTGSFTNGTVFGSNEGSQPLFFIAGSNQIIPGFNQAVMDMTVNQTKNVTLPVNEAYGPVNQSLIIQVPLSEFGNRTVGVGEHLSSNTGRYGVITAINNTTATIDFNSPLAGKILRFQITVRSIKKQ